jgi:NAD/NADP transhydrogenase beta subunit
MLHIIASFFGVFIGGVTMTGSLAAFRKLHGLWPKETMNLPMAG